MIWWRAAGRVAAGLLLTTLVLAGPVEAAPTRALSDGRLLASEDPVQRAAGIDVARAAGAQIARIPIAWSTVVDQSLLGPAPGLIPLSDPAHPAYDWSRIDAALRDLAAADLTPLVYFATVPPWAQSAPRYRYAWIGTWAPRPAALADFASAVARRFDGTYPDPQRPGQALPRVRLFQTWNEPNIARYLQPQWVASNDGRAKLFAPGWYRRMHVAAYRAIHARQPDAVVGLAGLAPTGDHTEGGARVEPLRFLRALLCLGVSRRACPAPLPFDAIAIHPLSTGDPDVPAARQDDITVADLEPKLTDLIARAQSSGRISRATANSELWVTELNWTSAEAGGVPAHKQAAVIGRAMRRLDQAGASIVGWQFATDPPLDRTFGQPRPAGLTAAAPGDPRQLPGAPKRFLGGFGFPVAAVALDRRSTYVWAQLPTATGSVGELPRRATVEQRRSSRGSAWRAVARLTPDATGAAASAIVRAPEGSWLRVRVDDGPRSVVSEPVRAVLRLGRVRASTGTQAQMAAADGTTPAQVRTTPAPVDMRPADPDGPGVFPTIPPAIAGGAPPAPNGRFVIPRAVADAPRRPRRFAGTTSRDVILGTTADDLLLGLGGSDLLIGFGGHDRIIPGGGRPQIVRRAR